MSTFESLGGCSSYIRGKANIENVLPKSKPFCQYCIYLSYHAAYERHYCRITNEWILNYKKEKGDSCPFEWSD